MSESKDSGDKTLSVGGGKRLSLKKDVESGQVRQSFSRGRSKAVVVEKKRKRVVTPRGETATEKKTQKPAAEKEPVAKKPAPAAEEPAERQKPAKEETEGTAALAERAKSAHVLPSLTSEEKEARHQALSNAIAAAETARRRAEEEKSRREEEESKRKVEREEALKRQREEEERRAKELEARRRAEEEAAERLAEEERRRAEEKGESEKPAPAARPSGKELLDEEVQEEERKSRKKAAAHRPAAPRTEPRRRGRLTVQQALEGEAEEERQRSLAALRRAREREKRVAQGERQRQRKIVREVTVPEEITVQELANRMAVRAREVVSVLSNMDVTARVETTIDADTAEIVVEEMGHRAKRVAEADVEIGLEGNEDTGEDLKPRAPVVTVMGHVDHGKTSLLDALRSTDVVAGEAGGITQHIGAYQVTVDSGDRVTFIDTPGHEAFTAMRARGAKVTDLVILVVAADDGVMPQTVEAINHAKAAEVPMIVAINKMDRPEANPDRVRQELLQHEVFAEEMGGDVLTVEVSAVKKTGLDKLVEAILLQAELLELKANPERPAEGVVIEARLDKGRGAVATVLVQRGTLKRGDVFVMGAEWGRVRAMMNDRGEQVKSAGPSIPVEILGLQGPPEAGDDFIVVDDESRAREVSEFRQRRQREERGGGEAKSSLEDMLAQMREEKQVVELPVVIKGDVQGSVEAIIGALQRIGTDDARINVLHSGVGGVTESDVTLAAASNALIIGFNVRANKQAQDAAKRDGIEIRYYSIIYDLVDEVKAALAGMLEPERRETQIGTANVLEVFSASKVGRAAGCLVTDGAVRRGAHVRLIRDDVVIHEGMLASLRRFKDEVREVSSGTECGIAFESFQDIKEGDVIECFEVQEVARQL